MNIAISYGKKINNNWNDDFLYSFFLVSKSLGDKSIVNKEIVYEQRRYTEKVIYRYKI